MAFEGLSSRLQEITRKISKKNKLKKRSESANYTGRKYDIMLNL